MRQINLPNKNWVSIIDTFNALAFVKNDYEIKYLTNHMTLEYKTIYVPTCTIGSPIYARMVWV